MCLFLKSPRAHLLLSSSLRSEVRSPGRGFWRGISYWPSSDWGLPLQCLFGWWLSWACECSLSPQPHAYHRWPWCDAVPVGIYLYMYVRLQAEMVQQMFEDAGATPQHLHRMWAVLERFYSAADGVGAPCQIMSMHAHYSLDSSPVWDEIGIARSQTCEVWERLRKHGSSIA